MIGDFHYVWLAWSSTFLAPWATLYLINRGQRGIMWRASLATAALGLTEPIFVPAYWNPPSLFDLAQRTGFDIESLIFCFAIGGIGVVSYNTLTRQDVVTVDAQERGQPRHRFHRAALLAPYALFVPLWLLPWNPIYPSIVCLLAGATASVTCRPDLKRKTLLGGILFLGLYSAFMVGLRWLVPGYIERVWNLPALSGVLIQGIPLEEIVFGLSFGMYWSGVYEHVTWHTDVRHAHPAPPPRPEPPPAR